MNLGLVIFIFLIVLVAGALICIGWWKLADKWFPGTSRKTGQEIRLTKKREQDLSGATVIKLDEKE